MKKKSVKIVSKFSILLRKQKTNSSNIEAIRHKKIEKGAKDFANRFEGVMQELANG